MMRALHLMTLLSGVVAYHFPILPALKCIQLPLASTTTSDDDSSTHYPASFHSDRRAMISSIAMATAFITNVHLSAYAQDTEQSTLEKRILANSLSPPSYGMEATDIFYPPYFQGSWKAVSKTTNLYAPCGFELFPGGESGYDNTVQKEIKGDDVLEYRARFVGSGDDLTIADREYNAKEIAKAAMGSFSVVDVSEATPNRFSCLLAPPEGSGGSLICVDILAIARKYEAISPNKFCCSEVVRQIVSPANKSNPNAQPSSPLSVKEVETISIYANNGDVKKIDCKQRTSIFLVPSQTDPIAFKKWQMSRGQPVDIRYYDVTYSKI